MHIGQEHAQVDGYDVTTHDDGTTTITGRIVDQAELRALLGVLDDLNIEVVSVNRVAPA